MGEESNNSNINILPPGFRFHPTDEELITYYLTNKLSDTHGFTSKAIAVVDLNKSEPWDLPGKASMGEKEWYFFSLRDRKYPTGLRTNRATESGYWKTTGKDKEIFSNGVLVGMKKTLVFYKGRAPRGHKTNWVMHEYRLHNYNSFTSKEEWVVCRVFQKSILSSSAPKKPQETRSPSQVSLESPNCDTTSMVNNEFSDIDIPNFSVNPNSSSTTSFTDIHNQNNLLAQTNTLNNANHHNHHYTIPNNITNMNWAQAHHTFLPSLNNMPSWPMLNPNNLSSVNSLLLKALQLKSYHQQANNDNHHFASSYIPQLLSPSPTDLISNLNASNSSSSKVLDCMPQQQQPFNLDSVDW